MRRGGLGGFGALGVLGALGALGILAPAAAPSLALAHGGLSASGQAAGAGQGPVWLAQGLFTLAWLAYAAGAVGVAFACTGLMLTATRGLDEGRYDVSTMPWTMASPIPVPGRSRWLIR